MNSATNLLLFLAFVDNNMMAVWSSLQLIASLTSYSPIPGCACKKKIMRVSRWCLSSSDFLSAFSEAWVLSFRICLPSIKNILTKVRRARRWSDRKETHHGAWADRKSRFLFLPSVEFRMPPWNTENWRLGYTFSFYKVDTGNCVWQFYLTKKETGWWDGWHYADLAGHNAENLIHLLSDITLFSKVSEYKH